MRESPSSSTDCAVCGERNHGTHFGVKSCRACSSFWRRSLVERKKYTCRYDGKCPVSKAEMRNTCRACRWERCKQVGMKEEIPCADIHEVKPSSSVSESENSVSTPESTNLVDFSNPNLVFIDPSDCPTNDLERFAGHYRVFCCAERSMYMLEHPEDLFSSPENIKLKPLRRPEHLRMECGTVSLVHTLLTDTTDIYAALPREWKLPILKLFSSEFLCLHRSYASAKASKGKDTTIVVHHGYYYDEECAMLFFEGSDKLEEHVEFVKPILKSLMITVERMKALNLTEPEVMAIAMIMFYNNLHDLNLLTPETQRVVDSIHNELVYYISTHYGIEKLATRLGNIQSFMHHTVKQAAELRELMVMARIFFPYAGCEIWEDLSIYNDEDHVTPSTSASSQ